MLRAPTFCPCPMPSICLALPPLLRILQVSFLPLLSFPFCAPPFLHRLTSRCPSKFTFLLLCYCHVTLLEARVVLAPRLVLDFASVLIMTGAFGQQTLAPQIQLCAECSKSGHSTVLCNFTVETTVYMHFDIFFLALKALCAC